MISFTPPPGYTRIRVVKSFDELVTTPFGGGVNALCWERTLAGDFSEVVERLGVSEGMTTLDDSRLNGLHLSAAGRAAVDVLLEDQRLLRARGLEPVLDCILGYPRDEEAAVILSPEEPEEFRARPGDVHAPLRLVIAQPLARRPDVGAKPGVRLHRRAIGMEGEDIRASTAIRVTRTRGL